MFLFHEKHFIVSKTAQIFRLIILDLNILSKCSTDFLKKEKKQLSIFGLPMIIRITSLPSIGHNSFWLLRVYRCFQYMNSITLYLPNFSPIQVTTAVLMQSLSGSIFCFRVHINSMRFGAYNNLRPTAFREIFFWSLSIPYGL